MNFCSHCGHRVTLRIPEGDNLPRHVCDQCQTIHYLNPRIVVGAIPVWEDKVLLCRRAIEPRRGYWTLPAGFMENGESTGAAAIRETAEEACARITLQRLHTMVNVPHISQVHMLYLARLDDLAFAAGTESLEVRLFAEDEIPWHDLAFRSVDTALRHFFEDRRSDAFVFRVIDLPPA